MGRLEGKVAVITGGNSGIGLATAQLFVTEGAYVFITGRRQSELDAAVKQIGKNNVTGVQGDVSSLADLDRLYDTVKQQKGRIDVLFANQVEIEALAGVAHLESAVAAIAPKVETLVVTRSEDGALAVGNGERADVPAEPIDQLVDTTGAGDLFAAGFLLGTARGKSLEQSLRLGAISAAEVIQHYGARPEANLKALAGELLA